MRFHCIITSPSAQNNKESEISISLMIQIKVHKNHVYNNYMYTITVYHDDVRCMSR